MHPDHPASDLAACAEREGCPCRIQLRRTKGWRMPENTVKVDRSTIWGNPFVPGQENMLIPGRMVEDKRHAWRLFQGHAPHNPNLVEAARAVLAGCNLACWCRLCERHAAGKPVGVQCEVCEPCHADVLLELANTPARPDQAPQERAS